MHVAIVGPIGSSDIRDLLARDTLPQGYLGAPLLGTLIRALLARGHRVSAFTTSADIEAPVSYRAGGFAAHYIPCRKRAYRFERGQPGRAVDYFRLERNMLVASIRDAAPDVVHGHWAYEFGLASVECGIPHVITVHDSPKHVLRYSPSLYRLVKYFMATDCLARAKTITAVSPYLGEAISGIAHSPVHIIGNPLASSESVDLKECANHNEPRLIMICNGWSRRKNPKVALRAFALLRKEIPTASFHLYGTDFEPGGRAHHWTMQNKLTQSVLFHGAVEHRALLKALQSSTLLLHPALEESFGMVVAEAMHCGVPVVAGTGRGALPWLIGTGGVLTDVTSPHAMAAATLRLLKEPGALERCRLAAERRAAAFSSAAIAEQYETLYSRNA